MGDVEFLPVEVVLRRIELGDIIEFNRGPYIHYGIYSGKKKVIHYAPNVTEEQARRYGISSSCGVELFGALFHGTEFKAVCKEEHIRLVAGLDFIRINNKEVEAEAKHIARRQPEETLKIAREEVGKEVKYHFLNNNCEKMATRCFYKCDGWSNQSEAIMKSVIQYISLKCGHLLDFLRENDTEVKYIVGQVLTSFVSLDK